MNFNIITYSIYLPIMIFITVVIGYALFKNGRVFILRQLDGDEELTDFINKILLVGYYLMNLGFCFYIVADWEEIQTWEHLMSSLSQIIGQLVLGLGIMHFVNIAVLIVLGNRNQKVNNQIYNNH